MGSYQTFAVALVTHAYCYTIILYSVYTYILQLAMFGVVDCSLYSVRSRLVAGKHVDANICAIIYVNMYVYMYVNIRGGAQGQVNKHIDGTLTLTQKTCDHVCTE